MFVFCTICWIICYLLPQRGCSGLSPLKYPNSIALNPLDESGLLHRYEYPDTIANTGDSSYPSWYRRSPNYHLSDEKQHYLQIWGDYLPILLPQQCDSFLCSSAWSKFPHCCADPVQRQYIDGRDWTQFWLAILFGRICAVLGISSNQGWFLSDYCRVFGAE